MRQNVLLRTNIFICTVIVLGFLVTSVVSFYSNNGIFRKDVEHISKLTAEGIYHEIDSIFTKPINIALTMANDNLLKTFLAQEQDRENDPAFVETMRDYLRAYQVQYGYDSVFLVSARTSRYYHFQQGIDRVLREDEPEDTWYYSFLTDPRTYNLNIDNDQARSAHNGITIFINCKIYTADGQILGVVGVGFSVDTLQQIFREYEETFGLRAYLVDENGTIEISTTQTGFVRENLFSQACGYQEFKDAILSDQENTQNFWYGAAEGSGFLVAKFVRNLDWYLLIENDTSTLDTRLRFQFLMGVTVVLVVIGIVLLIITGLIRKYNAQIVRLTVRQEKEHRTIFQMETQKLYENIYEIDITHNRAASEETESYFESLGAPRNLPYHEALEVIAREQIQEEFREGYIHMFSPVHVLHAYDEGLDSLCYDFMTTSDGGKTYYWMRITARIFYWEDDRSVRMLVYRQNIDQEKRREAKMVQIMRLDPLSGLYNKAATQDFIMRRLAAAPTRAYAFFILDIDNFKRVNDTYGHVVGDKVIADFAKKLKQQFREEDIVGRIGGDEFMVLVPALSYGWVERKAADLAQALQYEFCAEGQCCPLSASIGAAISPAAGTDFDTLYKNADSALYETKKKGKRGYTIFQPSA